MILPPYVQRSASRSKMPIIALVLGITALLAFWTVIGGVVFGITAIVLGVVSRRQAKHAGLAAKGAATGGVVTGAIAVALAFAFAVWAVMFPAPNNVVKTAPTNIASTGTTRKATKATTTQPVAATGTTVTAPPPTADAPAVPSNCKSPADFWNESPNGGVRVELYPVGPGEVSVTVYLKTGDAQSQQRTLRAGEDGPEFDFPSINPLNVDRVMLNDSTGPVSPCTVVYAK